MKQPKHGTQLLSLGVFLNMLNIPHITAFAILVSKL